MVQASLDTASMMMDMSANILATYTVTYLSGKLCSDSPVGASSSVVTSLVPPPSSTTPSGELQEEWR